MNENLKPDQVSSGNGESSEEEFYVNSEGSEFCRIPRHPRWSLLGLHNNSSTVLAVEYPEHIPMDCLLKPWDIFAHVLSCLSMLPRSRVTESLVWAQFRPRPTLLSNTAFRQCPGMLALQSKHIPFLFPAPLPESSKLHLPASTLNPQVLISRSNMQTCAKRFRRHSEVSALLNILCLCSQ